MNLAAISEDSAELRGTSVQAIIATSTANGGNAITDVDTGAVEGIAILGVSGRNANGWEFSDNGLVWQKVGAVSNAAARLIPTNWFLRYVPDGLNGETADRLLPRLGSVRWHRRRTARCLGQWRNDLFSSATEIATILVSDVNDNPVAVNDSYPTNEDVS